MVPDEIDCVAKHPFAAYVGAWTARRTFRTTADGKEAPMKRLFALLAAAVLTLAGG